MSESMNKILELAGGADDMMSGTPIGDFEHDGKKYTNWTEELAIARGIPQAVIDAAKAGHDASVQAEKDKMTGFDFSGVMCSATRKDQDGLVAVERAIANNWITETTFVFQNGNELVLNGANIAAFGQAFATFRNGFFS